MRRKVARKISKKKKLKKRAEPADYTGRKYEDYIEFIKNNPCSPTTEMDTVYNHQEGPYIQTFMFENTGFMIGLLKQHKTAEEMSDSLNYFQDILPAEMYHINSLSIYIISLLYILFYKFPPSIQQS